MPLTRRDFLAATATITLGSRVRGAQAPATGAFRHGVASGDPGRNRVVLWTRVTPRVPDAGSIRVRWELASADEPWQVVRAGTVTTTAARDYTVKVDATGLAPGRPYRYRFMALGETSVVGHTAVPPLDPARLRLAVVSCSNYPAGYFNAYAAIAERDDVDLVLHLGDYVYEFANGVFGDGTPLGRVPDPAHEAVSLGDYRRRYATYRSDPDLQQIHARLPFITVWDDHELADNAWFGGGDGWPSRRAAAIRAYLEWMPVREDRDVAADGLYRAFEFGSLATLSVLDARSLRDGQVFGSDRQALGDPRRRVLGARQERWLAERLAERRTRDIAWSLVGQQVMFSPFTPPGQNVRNPDSWDGYQAERARLRELFAAGGNTVVLTGDVHSSWAFDMPLDPWSGYRPDTGEGSRSVELITPAVSSPPYFSGDDERTLGTTIRRSLPHLRYLNGEQRGWLLVDIDRARVEATWLLTPDVTRRSSVVRTGAALTIEAGSNRLAPR
jgi:alkaline phosphatase D